MTSYWLMGLVCTFANAAYSQTVPSLFEHKRIEFELPINSFIYTVDADKLAAFLRTELSAYITSQSRINTGRVIREAIRKGETPPRTKRYLVQSNITLTPLEDNSDEYLEAGVIPSLPGVDDKALASKASVFEAGVLSRRKQRMTPTLKDQEERSIIAELS